MRRDILVFPDDRLKTKSEPIVFDRLPEDFGRRVSDMLDTFSAAKNAVGLAAIQIDWPVAMFLMPDRDGFILVANPAILDKAAGTVSEKVEGCLSFPGVYEKVNRFEEIRVEYDQVDFRTLKPEHVTKTLTGLEAQVFQHELEHLNGIVLADNLTAAKAKTIRNRLGKWKMKGYRWP